MCSCSKTSSSSTDQNTQSTSSSTPNISSNQCPSSPSKSAQMTNQTRLIDGIPVTDSTIVPGGTSNVAILIPDKTDPSSGALCSGTFISEHVFLTAAHCFTSENQVAQVTGSNQINLTPQSNGISPIKLAATSKQIKINEFFLKYCTPYPEADRDPNICSIGDIALILINPDPDKTLAKMGVTIAHVTTATPPPSTAVHFVRYEINPNDPTYTPGTQVFTKRYGTAKVSEYASIFYITPPIHAPLPLTTPTITATTFETLLADPEVLKYFPKFADLQMGPNLTSTLIFMNAATKNDSGICYGDSGSAIYVDVSGNCPGTGASTYAAVAIAHAAFESKQAGATQCSLKQSVNLSIAPYVDWINKNMFGEGPLQISNPPATNKNQTVRAITVKIFNGPMIFMIILFFMWSCNKTSSPPNSLTPQNTPNIQPPNSGQCTPSTSTSTKLSPSKMQNRLIDGVTVPDGNTQIPGVLSNVNLIMLDSCNNPVSACTGTFISPHVILTAAHCFTGENQVAKITSINQINLQQKQGGIPDEKLATSTKVKINEFYLNYCTPYPENNQDSMICSIGDLALVNTDKSAADIGATVASVTTTPLPNNSTVHFVGYGISSDTDTNNPLITKRYGTANSLMLSSDEVASFNNKNIKGSPALPKINATTRGGLSTDPAVLSFLPNFPGLIPSLVLVTATSTNITGVCHGDSGSSIYVNVSPSSGSGSSGSAIYSAAAVTHAISGQCSDKFSLNLAIAPYVGWINANMFGEGPLQTIP